ncbi:MAG: hypothetical protein U9Q05_12185, partial [Thermodesulfobacteriota bacterium]|nr:hypothetical protein [Thermodesulfobacteriota bacterium]
KGPCESAGRHCAGCHDAGKDGYEMCAELKDDEKCCDIPIVLLTAVASHVTSTRYTHADGMSTEADDYIAKPASAEEITDSVKRLLNVV